MKQIWGPFQSKLSGRARNSYAAISRTRGAPCPRSVAGVSACQAPQRLSAIKHSSCFERVVGARHTRREVEVERDGRRPAQAIADIEQVASQEEEEQEGHEEEDGGADGVPRVGRGHEGGEAGQRVHEAAVIALPARRAVARAVEAVAVA